MLTLALVIQRITGMGRGKWREAVVATLSPAVPLSSLLLRTRTGVPFRTIQQVPKVPNTGHDPGNGLVSLSVAVIQHPANSQLGRKIGSQFQDTALCCRETKEAGLDAARRIHSEGQRKNGRIYAQLTFSTLTQTRTQIQGMVPSRAG